MGGNVTNTGMTTMSNNTIDLTAFGKNKDLLDNNNRNDENNSNNNEDNEDITPSLKESYNFIKEIPLLHKDLEGQS